MPDVKRGSQHIVGGLIETVYGVINATPVFAEIPITRLRRGKNMASIRSGQLRRHPFVNNLLPGMNTQDVEIGAELQPKNHDILMRLLCGSNWTADVMKVIDGLIGMTLESQFPGAFSVYVGLVINRGEFTFSADEDAPIGVTFSGMAIDATLGNPTSASASPITAAVDVDPFVAGDTSVFLNGSGTELPVTAINFRVEREVNPLRVLGTRRARQMVPGAVTLTGSMTIPFENTDMVIAAQAFADATIKVRAESYDALSYFEFLIPRLKRGTIGENVEGRGALLQDYDFEAYYDPTTQTVLQVTRHYPA